MGRRLNRQDFGNERKPTRWRGIFMGIIALTLPFYCIGFGLWLFAPSPTAPTATPTATPFLTFTPLGSDRATNTPATPAIGITLIATTDPQILPTFPPPATLIPPTAFVFPSQVPTFFVTNTPPPAPTVTVTPAPTNTSAPTQQLPPTDPPPTQPPLLPPTNTPEGS